MVKILRFHRLEALANHAYIISSPYSNFYNQNKECYGTLKINFIYVFLFFI